ncbi:MAG: hypothetical protein NT069_05970, partial [Planctomycetota bacterium]|nr:hypothetical protein [Planctomycetota bacterium]
VGYPNQPHREFIQRQAFEVGRHIVGYEVQKTLAAVDLLEQFANRDAKSTSRGLFPIGVAGIGEGGLLALYSAAIDSRIQSCLVSGYFQEREGVWQEPIYRDVWGLLTEFGDADLAGLVAPRRLVIEACGVPLVAGPPPGRNGRRESAAPGRIAAIDLGSVEREYNLAQGFYERAGKSQELILAQSGETGQNSPGSESAIRQFAAGLGIVVDAPLRPWRRDVVAQSEVSLFDSSARQRRQMDELQVHVQSVLRQGHQTRDGKWRVNWNTVAEWEQSRGALRDWVHDELIGRLPVSPQPVKPRSRVVLETDAYTGYEVVLDVADDVIAAGILLLPKDLKPGEKRPLVVCQHGLEGVPMDTISRDPKPFGYYKAFADELARRGFLVFAPQNPCRGGENFRVLQRMSHPLQRTLFSYIIAQHATTLDWLATLDCVDARRIGFYGLSYGGKTAMRVPPLVDGYCLSICSGDFTDWVRTIASNEEPFSYLFTIEHEIPEWNMAHVASYAELALLMSPRPFMVEAGHRDGGQPTEWVAGEFGKVRRHYDLLKIGDRAEIEFFDGPHTIHGEGTFRFLHRHLNWPTKH